MTNPDKVTRSETFTERLREIFAKPLQRAAEIMSKLGLHPDTLTLIGAGLTGIGAVYIARGEFFWASIWIFFSGPFDALDGALARYQDRHSPFGAFFDSFVDRYIEIFLYGGFLYYFYTQEEILGVILSYVAAAGSVLVSYARSRAEGLGYSIKGGLFTRVERYIVIMIVLIFQAPLIGIGILAAGNNFTAFQRAWYAYSKMKN